MKETVTANSVSVRIKTEEDIFKYFSSHILQLLQGYYFQKRGRVHSLVIKSLTLDDGSNSSSGTFYVFFKISYSQGCQDISFEESESMRVNFSSGNQSIEFIGEEIPERDSNEF